MDDHGAQRPKTFFGINLPELVSGVVLVVFGIFVVIEASGYRLGTLTRMGPGYFPIILGFAIAGLGIAVVAEGRVSREVAVLTTLRPFACILLSMLAFAFLVERFGLVPATVALVFISSFAQQENRLLPMAVLAAGVAILGAIIFLYGFGVPLAIIRW